MQEIISMSLEGEINLIPLEKSHIYKIVLAFKEIGWNKPANIYEKYLAEQSMNERLIILAMKREEFCGYVTLKWKSDYPNFKNQNIPEISDLNVLPIYRNNGIGSSLIRYCELMVAKKGLDRIGIGVGMTVDYGNAQRLYVQMGYIPDGRGLHYKNFPVSYDKQVLVDDDLVLYFTKNIMCNKSV